MGHEPAQTELFHRRQVKAVQGSHVRPWPLAVLTKGDREDRPRERADHERVLPAQEVQPLGQPAIPVAREAATKPRRAQLNFGLQLDQRRKHDSLFRRHGSLHGGAFGLGQEELQQ